MPAGDNKKNSGLPLDRYCFAHRMSRRLSIMFICQAGAIELKAAVLAASLRYHLGEDIAVYACIPVPFDTWKKPSIEIINFLDSLKIRLRSINNPFSSSYPYGNKIGCFQDVPYPGKTIFLDSDIILLRPFDVDRVFHADFLAKPVDYAISFAGNDDTWKAIYSLCGCEEESRRLFATVGGNLMWPYFNSGVIGVNTNSRFGEEWIACSRLIDRVDSIPNKRPHLDQISLPLAVLRSGLEFSVLPERFNFPAHVKSIYDSDLFLCHYHWPRVIAREPKLATALLELIHAFPSLASILRGQKDWSELLSVLSNREMVYSNFVTQKNARQKNGFITGIPRSGTSLLCRLMADQPDHLVINEPSEVIDAVRDQWRPWLLTALYAEWRHKFMLAEPVMNKVVDGSLVEDTVGCDRRSLHYQSVDNPDFALWTKNTLAYLARLSSIHDVFPDAVIVACVRHPFDAIASWISSFDHLKDADVHHFPVGGVGDSLLSGKQAEDIDVIAKTKNIAMRRALLWRHLAEMIITYRRNLVIIRYEDLLLDARAELWRALSSLDPTVDPGDIVVQASLSLRSKRHLLADADIRAIRDVCMEPAADLGYDLNADTHGRCL